MSVRIVRAIYYVFDIALFPFYKALTIWILSCVFAILLGYVIAGVRKDYEAIFELDKWQNIFDLFTFSRNSLPSFVEYLALLFQVIMTCVFYFGLL